MAVAPLRAGAVIEFKDKKGILLAICKRLEGTSLRLLTESGKEFSYPADKVAHVTSHMLDPTLSDPHLKERLAAIRDRVLGVAGSIELADLWEFFSGSETDGITLEEMARTYFGESTGSDHQSALLRALHDDPLYFKKKGELYVPKPAEAVAETRRQLAEQDRRQRERGDALAWFRAARLGHTPPRPEGLERHIDLLRGLAIHREDFAGYTEAAGLLHELGEEVPDGAFGFLVEIGDFGPDENLMLLKEGIPTGFSPELVAAANEGLAASPVVLEAAAALASLYVPGGSPQLTCGPGGLPRLDLQELPAISVDDSETRDIDDALSLERLADGFRIGVHIADLSAAVPKDSPLDREAFRRATTVYLPDRTIPMIPEAISHEAASLLSGQPRLALSLFADVDTEARLRSFFFSPSVLRVERAATYEEAAEMLEDPAHPLAPLGALASKLREQRIGRGARVFERAELKIRVAPDGTITLKKRQGESVADVVVSELMILANQCAGVFCAGRAVAAVYRVQPPPQEEIAAGAGAVSRRFLTMVKKIQVQTSPGPHWGLGLESYAQMTSPIRRYLDLVMHRQLRRALGEGDSGYTEDALREAIGGAESAVEAAHNTQRWSNKYWLLKYLSGRVGEPTPAVIQEVRDESYLVQLTDYLFDIPFYPPPGRKYQVGDLLEVRVKAVDPRKGLLKVQEAGGRR
ncbi:MAG: RNB domain-containing ribonuclease [Candidatus Wallbacteria bacterium]|nr:RNB domain-containing ribonuclease [Candidatus Wallbacteria bacterium]